jgi:hypothetical protein
MRKHPCCECREVVTEILTVLGPDKGAEVFRELAGVKCDPEPWCANEEVNGKPFALCRNHRAWAVSVEKNFQRILSNIMGEVEG